MPYVQDCWPSYYRPGWVVGGHVWKLWVATLPYQYKNTPTFSLQGKPPQYAPAECQPYLYPNNFNIKKELRGQ